MGPQDLANSLWALAQLRCAVPVQLARQAETRRLAAPQLAACAWALATARCASERWLQRLVQGPGAVGACAWALATCERPELLQKLLPRAVEALEGRPQVETLLQLAWATSMCGLAAPELLRRVEELLRDEGRRRDADAGGAELSDHLEAAFCGRSTHSAASCRSIQMWNYPGSSTTMRSSSSCTSPCTGR